MHDFLIGLQFLTRIHLVKQEEWSAESFGRSVKFFPLVGLVIGIILAMIAYFLTIYFPENYNQLPRHITSTLLLVFSILLTGGLHCDGFMDTMDGVFSGRSRERMLEIMKDSRVGANGVVAFVILFISKWSLFLDLSPEKLITALFVMPIISRLGMVMGVTLFPYARPSGIGKAFAQYANKTALVIATFITLLFVIPMGTIAVFSLFCAILFTLLFSKYITNVLGGLTGDVYGALTELNEVIILFVFLFST